MDGIKVEGINRIYTIPLGVLKFQKEISCHFKSQYCISKIQSIWEQGIT